MLTYHSLLSYNLKVKLIHYSIKIMGKPLSQKQLKAVEVAKQLKINYSSHTELFQKLKDKGYDWDRDMADWVNHGHILSITIKWGDDGHVDEIAQHIITFLQDELPDYKFSHSNPDYRIYTPKDKEGKLLENCEAATLFFKSKTGEGLTTTDNHEDFEGNETESEDPAIDTLEVSKTKKTKTPF